MMRLPLPVSCLHCEKNPPGNRLGLCLACSSKWMIRRLYLRRRGWTPVWELHLRRLAERAQLRLPLFSRG